MLEKMARAIYEARCGGGNWDVLKRHRNGPREVEKWLLMARAALTALREPDVGMHQLMVATTNYPDETEEAWRLVVDHILNEKSG